jgi:glycosyltransferase involved in cell wall biosynthesis
MHWVFATAVSSRELVAARPDLGRPLHTPPRLVFIGRLSAEKGVHLLFEALKLLRARLGTALPEVAILGDGPERGSLEVQARKLDLPVEFAGQLDRPGMARYLLQADLCVQPSLSEGFSKAWLDAMAYGVPVLASDVGAARSVVGRDGERGWLVRPGDVDALAEELEQVLGPDVDWATTRRRCIEFVQEHTLEAWGRRIGDLCSEQWGPLSRGRGGT